MISLLSPAKHFNKICYSFIFNRRFSLNLIANLNNFQVENEPVLEYLSGSEERTKLEAKINKYLNDCVEIPLIIDGKQLRSSIVKNQLMPFDHSRSIAKYYWATEAQLKNAIESCLKKRFEWENDVTINEKISIFLKAADLVSNKYRMDLNAATMLGQSKTIVQAEIDAAAELADFFRFNAYFAKELHKYQPISTNPSVVKNSFRYRGLEGFVAAISPFNFTAIGGNLSSAPTLMGNVVLWKPSDTAMLSNYLIYELLIEAGIPPGVINFVPSDGPTFGNVITSNENLAGINFTGSVATFQHLWQQTSNNLTKYKNFPRLIGECGGKNFHFVHRSADVETVVNATIRSAFEFGGQKCSACSRIYAPKSIWPSIKSGLIEIMNAIKVGSPLDYEQTFFSAVIDAKAFKRITSYIQYAQQNSNKCKILSGGKYDDSVGYYIQPTLIETTDPNDRLMKEEIFGPVLTAFVYDDNDLSKTLQLCNESTNFALTGAIFAKDQEFLTNATTVLKMSAGNFYVNDKSTGSVVGQQPFGGGRLSGTNDKAGGPHYLLRWTSPQNVKETFVPQTQWKYKYMK